MSAYKGLFNVGQTFCGISKQVIKSNANICMNMNIIFLYKRQLMHKSHKGMTKNIKCEQDANFKRFNLDV
jgi:hypothetical protein